MQRKKVPHIKKICILFGVALCVSVTSAFSFPSLQDIRQAIHEKIENLWARTPAAKELAAWKKARVEAENALKEATINNASTYAHESLFEAQNLLARADSYAAGRAYYKAAYLANKAQDKAIAAKKLAQKTRKERLDAAKTELDAIGLSIAQLGEKYKKMNRKMPYEYNELILAWRDLTHALATEQLQDIFQNIPDIQKKIDYLNT
ncbi:MAG: hypothetical protein ACUVQV_07330, partial [Dissulfurimicrobium sp.]